MSEYQYYEFQAIDRPLDECAMAYLRSLTSRARITPTSLVNVYHFGDFKGDPDRLMDLYFDAHLYVANWGTRRLMLRLPARAFDLASAEPYCAAEGLEARATKEHVILDFHSNDEGGDYFEEEGEGWLASMIPLRSDLIAGDLRCLYLGWLAGVESGEVDEDQPEPPVPPGLGKLSGPLRQLADFLRVDPDLIEIAAAASGEGGPDGPSPKELAAWVAKLSQGEKDSLLVRLMQGEGASLGGELLLRFRKDRARTVQGVSPSSPRRTAGELIEARDRLAAEKSRRAAEKAAKEKDRRDREAAAARDRYLNGLIGREDELWEQVEAAIKTRLPKEYDRAVELLKDLRDLAERDDVVSVVVKALGELRERHRAKSTLIQRLDRAGLPK